MVEVVNLGAQQTAYRLQVTFPVDAVFAAPYENLPVYLTQAGDRDAQLKAQVDAYENSVKSGWPEWLEKDAERNATFTVTGGPRPDPITPEAVEYWSVNVTWRVRGTVRIETTGETETAPYSPEYEAWAQQLGTAAAADWIASRSMTPVT